MIQFNIYDRADEDHGFMGSVKVKPTLVHDHTVDQWYKYVPFIPASSSSHTSPRVGPYENESNVTGEIRIQITFEQSKVAYPFLSQSCTHSHSGPTVKTISHTSGL
jgi:serine/threonine protein kinase SCH9